ncbi:unnamed protein product [Tilletia controversa]|uniref:DUF985 domain-containing protein n=3 Tax=Tilletia TaxID=13289 RepID=A0A8X7MSG8_9BASI|nr:hypothetical protein CF336_g5696 [Tilletia laevis]KAE8205515.1 hypothetical protein CF328_g466 [Tilletia controversa]KAE8265430.1 hypothetical protein A4X03_0g276 [Tilletia caries]KAE8195468.1 hypothetical protein CF335_g5094 [Tilletia laevis]KAE8246475.1 hypothetical protein A4X06_0g5001 [Tilletia controversa]
MSLDHSKQANSDLIKALKLEPHPEGGYFTLGWLGEQKVPTPFVADSPSRGLASTIYYLLALRPSSVIKQDAVKLEGSDLAVGEKAEDGSSKRLKWLPHSAVFHCNRSAAMHLHHAGRAKYTLIEAHPPAGQRPRIKEVIVGPDSAGGEVRQLLVEGGDGGWWKRSEIVAEDIPKDGEADEVREHVGCLISEVVIPGFDWADHRYMREADLRQLFGDDEASIARFLPHVGSDASH